MPPEPTPAPNPESTSDRRLDVRVGVVGAGPAGLMAAEVLAGAGLAVDLYDAMPSVGRKFLLAGKGGLNLTHSEPLERFIGRYSTGRAEVAGWLTAFGPGSVRAWAEGLGVATFVGSSGRVFPADLKAAPLLRAWLHRLRGAGVRVHTHHRWIGWTGDESRTLRFATRSGELRAVANAWILALGGASWPQLGSDGAWVELLAERGVGIAPLRAANCGFDVEPTIAGRVPVPVDGTAEEADPQGWSRHFRSRFAGQPLKAIALAVGDPANPRFRRRGECVVTQTGVEGNLVYAASADIHDEIAAWARAVVHLDLLPDRSLEYVRSELARPRGSRSLSSHMKSRLGIDGVKAALLHELLPPRLFAHPADLAGAIKSLPLTLARPRPLAEAISTAGGVRFEELTRELMPRRVRGVFCAGEMLDWDAPTGGYLLTAALASGVVAGRGAFEHLGACGNASKVG